MKTFLTALLVLCASGAFAADVKGLSKVLATAKAAGEQGSPLDAVDEGLKLLHLKSSDMLLDAGCGDGRVIAQAVVDYDCRALGIEIDAAQADIARRTVVQSGVERQALIMLGDFTKYDFTLLGATKAYVYLYPDTLSQISKELGKLERVVSYMHPIPGLKTKKVGDFYVYDRNAPAEPEKMIVEKPVVKQKTTKRVEAQRYAVWNGQTHYREWNPGCNCDMCRSIRHQLAQPRYVEVEVEEPVKQQAAATTQVQVQPQSTGHWWWGCLNGKCGWHWIN